MECVVKPEQEVSGRTTPERALDVIVNDKRDEPF
jgi:hypothetical protein